MEWLDVYWDADIEAYLEQHEVSRREFEEVFSAIQLVRIPVTPPAGQFVLDTPKGEKLL